MGRVAIVFVVLAALAFDSKCDEADTKPVRAVLLEPGEIDPASYGMPVMTIESNFPTKAEHLVISYVKNALDMLPSDTVAAAKRIHDDITKLDPLNLWNVVIQPQAFFITKQYFAHYLYNLYNIYIFSLPKPLIYG